MLLSYMEVVVDPRRSQGKRYDLPHLLLFSVLALLSGAVSYRDIARFMKVRHEALNALFKLRWKGSPSKSMLKDTLCALDIEGIEQAFRAYSRALSKKSKEEIKGSADSEFSSAAP